MIKKAAIFIAVFSAVLITSPALAEDVTTTVSQKEVIQKRIEARKENISDKIATTKETIASREAALKAKLANFKDQRKATAAARISENLNRINDKRTEQMLKHLDRMSTILNKLDGRVDKGTADIKDAAAAKAAIASASALITSASAAAQDQAEKDYTIQVSTERKIKADAQTQRRQLHTDLQAVREQIIDARHALINAIRVAKSGKSADAVSNASNKEGTDSGQQ